MIKQTPDLRIFMDYMKEEFFDEMNCHCVGTIQSFDATKQTAEVSINFKRVTQDGEREYPLLVDCPIIMMFGSTGGLTFPIAKGDTCLVLFNDRDIDDWFEAGNIMKPRTDRKHSISDGIALVGVHHLGNKKSGYLTSGTQLFYGSTKVTLDDKIKLENAVTDLKTVVNGLIDVIKGLAVTPSVPLNAGSVAALEAYKTTIAGLLK
jgi:hypothetical protein